MHTLRKGISKLRQIRTKVLYNSQDLDRMCRHPRKQAHSIAAAIRAASARAQTEEEASWTRRIEDLRKRINASRKVITLESPIGDRDAPISSVEAVLGDYSRVSSKRYPWCLLLFQLVRNLQPQRCLELGTCVGFSASYQAAALQVNKAGSLLTLEGSPELARIAEDHLAQLGLSHRARVIVGSFEGSLPSVLEEREPFDFVFIDGHHEEGATWGYFQELLPHLGDGSVIVFDDIDLTAGMARVWERIKRHGSLAAVVDMIKVGVCLVDGSEAGEPDQYQAVV